jgi:hypothetical protein
MHLLGSRRSFPRQNLCSVTYVGERSGILDENLSQFVDPVVNEHVARTGDRRCSMGDIVDSRAHRVRRALRKHSRNCRRRSDLSGQTLHENCPQHGRLYAVSETIDGFGFQTRAKESITAFFTGTRCATPTRGGYPSNPEG